METDMMNKHFVDSNGNYYECTDPIEERNVLLLEVDAYVSNPLRWAALTEPTQTLLATYRQELLDVPQQAGFPDNIIWPTQGVLP